jgi:hypothetical protein
MATLGFRRWEKMISLAYHNVVISLGILNFEVKVILLPQEPEGTVQACLN